MWSRIQVLYIDSSVQNSILEFENCNISKVYFVNIQNLKAFLTESEFGSVSFVDIKAIKSLMIDKCTIGLLTVETSEIDRTQIGGFNLMQSKLDIIISNCEFTSSLSFYVINQSNVSLEKSTISTTSVSLIGCYDSKFIFNGVIFKNLTRVNTMDNKAQLSYNNVCFENELYISDDSEPDMSTETSIFFNETVFRDIAFFKETSLNDLAFYSCIFQKDVFIPTDNFEETSKSYKINSSVWCIKKNQALKQDNNVAALYYKRREMLSYEKQLKGIKGLWADKLLLLLNKLSNEHGLSWPRGLLFTVTVWIFFFTIYCWSLWGNEFHPSPNQLIFNYREFWHNAFNFLWLPSSDIKSLSYPRLQELSILSVILLYFSFILGKIMIGYGVYQTISAFRKHGKL